MSKEQFNWIRAYYSIHDGDDEREVFVRQEVEGSETFVDDKGNRYHISDLDLTRNTFEPKIFNLADFEKRNKETQAAYMEILSKMDKKAIADHQSVIDEAAYWRKLRGDIALEIIRQRAGKENYGQKDNYTWICNITDTVFNELYNQHQEFLTKK